MVFASPLWLFALLPWAGATLWLLWGRRRRTPVPFLELWRGPALQKPAKRALQPPPLFLAFALTAMGLALLAAARPRLNLDRAGAGAGPTITIIVDRGITMSASTGGIPRFAVVAKRTADALAPLLPSTTPVELYVLPGAGPYQADRASWLGKLDDLPPTAIDTQAALEAIVHDRLARGNGPVLLITDRRLVFDDPRLIQFSADNSIDNVGIIRIAARTAPTPQVMVRLRNDSVRKSTAIRVTSGARVVAQTVDLPPRGAERNYFFDFAGLDSTIEAALDVHDDQPADDRAWLLREGSAPKIEPRAPLSPQLRRMIDVFARLHPPSDSSQVVALVAGEADLPGQTPAVLIAPTGAGRAKGIVAVAAGPMTANVDWSAFPPEVETAGEAPRGWKPIVRVADRIIVAARTERVRAVWVGFDASGWSGTPDFVVFWANVFNWAGQGQESYAAYPLSDFEGPWKAVDPPSFKPAPLAGEWPGIYQGPEGALRAFSAPPATAGPPASSTADWRQRLEQADRSPGGKQQGHDLAPWALVLAVIGLAGAMVIWRRPRMGQQTLIALR